MAERERRVIPTTATGTGVEVEEGTDQVFPHPETGSTTTHPAGVAQIKTSTGVSDGPTPGLAPIPGFPGDESKNPNPQGNQRTGTVQPTDSAPTPKVAGQASDIRQSDSADDNEDGAAPQLMTGAFVSAMQKRVMDLIDNASPGELAQLMYIAQCTSSLKPVKRKGQLAGFRFESELAGSIR